MVVTIYQGDALAVLRTLPSESVQVCVTSPPYLGLRSYGTNPQTSGGDPDHDHAWGTVSSPGWRSSDTNPGPLQYAGNKGRDRLTSDLCACGAWRGELGLEPTPALFIEHIVTIFREVRRVLRSDGLVFCNIGDSYSGGGGYYPDAPSNRERQTARANGVRNDGAFTIPEHQQALARVKATNTRPGIPAKNLLLIPQRFAIAMQDDGWIVRSQIAWCLSGGTQVYVRSQKGDMSMSVKDMARLKPETLKVWNGERWTQVLRMWESTDDGDPIEIELRSGERIGCSPNHLWPTERGLQHAKDLKVGDLFKRVRLPEPEIPHQPIALDDEDIGWFVGLYLAEGCPSGRDIAIASHIKEVERFERVQRIAQAFDGSATMRPAGKNGATITVYGRILRAIVDEYISGKGAHGKHLSNACWRRSDVFLRGLLDGYLHGDGHWEEKNQRWRLGFARNYEFAADLRTICARLGAGLRLRPRFATLNGRSFPTFRGEIRFTRSGDHNEKSDDEIVNIGYSRGRKFWDIEVEDEPHTFALASGILTHNCKTSAMPESVRDRPTSAWEPIWMFAKSRTYYFDADAVRTPVALSTLADQRTAADGHRRALVPNNAPSNGATLLGNHEGANLRNVWTLGPEPSRALTWHERVCVSPDDADDDTERTTSPDCPVHGDRPASTSRCGEPLASPQLHIRRSDTGPAPAQRSEPAPTPDLSSEAWGQPLSSDHAATLRSTPSSRTGLRAETNPPCTAFEETCLSTDDTSTRHGNGMLHLDRGESSTTSGDSGDAPDPRSPADIADSVLLEAVSQVSTGPDDAPNTGANSNAAGSAPDGSSPSAGTPSNSTDTTTCTCSYSKVIIRESAHFAQFPSEIPRRCIKAGTSERGACPSCGAPWQRLTETTYRPSKGGGAHGKIGDARRDPTKRTDLPTVRLSRHDETLGWAPGCSCDAGAPVPCVVLDPFLGSGTTALVADQLGRNAIGIELSPAYAEMARKRIDADAGPMLSEPVQVTRIEQSSLFGAPAVFDAINWEDAILRVMEEDAQIVYGEHDATKEVLMDDALLEAISEKVHDAWSGEKVKQGFADHVFDFGGRLQSGEELCSVPLCGKTKANHHADMLPYADLAESTKDYDRTTVRAVFGAIDAAGYQVVRTNEKSGRRS